MGSNQSFYSVTITNPNASADLSAPSDGFIDFNTVENYSTNLETATLSFVQSTAKRRANIRYRILILEMNNVCNCYILPSSLQATNGAINTPPSAISFQLIIEHGDSSLYTNDENNPGSYLTGIAALTRMISRSLMYSKTNNGVYGDFKINIYDPTATTTVGPYASSTPFPRTGERIDYLEVGALCKSFSVADSTVSVTKLMTDLPPT